MTSPDDPPPAGGRRERRGIPYGVAISSTRSLPPPTHASAPRAPRGASRRAVRTREARRWDAARGPRSARRLPRDPLHVHTRTVATGWRRPYALEEGSASSVFLISIAVEPLLRVAVVGERRTPASHAGRPVGQRSWGPGTQLSGVPTPWRGKTSAGQPSTWAESGWRTPSGPWSGGRAPSSASVPRSRGGQPSPRITHEEWRSRAGPPGRPAAGVHGDPATPARARATPDRACRQQPPAATTVGVTLHCGRFGVSVRTRRTRRPWSPPSPRSGPARSGRPSTGWCAR
jgi:hypothetical protein